MLSFLVNPEKLFSNEVLVMIQYQYYSPIFLLILHIYD